MWCYCDESPAIGTVLFLGEIFNESNGAEKVVARSRAFAKNLSGERTLRGWCGSTNNVNVTAAGACEVVKLSARDNGRIMVRKIADDNARLVAIMEELDVTA